MRCPQCTASLTSRSLVQPSPMLLRCSNCAAALSDPYPQLLLIEPLPKSTSPNRRRTAVAAFVVLALLTTSVIFFTFHSSGASDRGSNPLAGASSAPALVEAESEPNPVSESPGAPGPEEPPPETATAGEAEQAPRSDNAEDDSATKTARRPDRRDGAGDEKEPAPSPESPASPTTPSFAFRIPAIIFANMPAVRFLTVSPDCRWLASAHADGTLRFVRLDEEPPAVETRTCERGAPRALAFHPAGNHLAVLSRHNVDFYEVGTWTRSLTIDSHGELSSLAFSPDGRFLATAERFGNIIVRRVDDLRPVTSMSGYGGALSVAWDTQNDSCIAACADNVVRIRSVDGSVRQRELFGHLDWVSSVAVSHEGERIVTGSWDRTVRVWDLRTLAAGPVLRGHSARITTVALNPQGTVAASGSDDGVIKVWSTTDGLELATLRGHLAAISSLQFVSTDTFVSASEDGSARAWNVSTVSEVPLAELGSRPPSPMTQALPPTDEYAEAIEKAGEFMTQERHAEAVECYQKATTIRPRYAEAHRCLGEALLGAGWHSEAVSAFRKATELRPDSGWSWHQFGNALELIGDASGARTAYGKAAELLPALVDAHLSVGRLLLSENRFGEALQAFGRALEARPGSPEALHGAGLAHAGEGRWVQAIDALKKAIDVKRDYADAYSDLIDVLIATDPGRAEEARGWAQLAQSQGLVLRPETVRRLEEALSAAQDDN